MSICDGCGAKVFHAFNEEGRPVTLDQRPNPDGTYGLDEAGVVEHVSDPVVRYRSQRHGRRFYTRHSCGQAFKDAA